MVGGAVGVVLGPLTTAWSMPASCTVNVLNCATCTSAYRGQACVMNGETGRAEDHTDCWPPVTSRAGTPRYPFLGWGYYSPGLACPTGYTTACTAEYGGRPGWEMQFNLVPGETAVGCCPTGYTCGNIDGNTCLAVATAGTPVTATTAMCSGTQLSAVAQAVFPSTAIMTASPGGVETVTRGISLMAPMFQLNYQASDLESAPSSASSQTTAPTPSTGFVSYTTGTTASSTSSASSDSSSAGSTQGGLSTGATIGLGVGAASGGILLTAVVVGVWMCLRKRARAAAAAVQAGQDTNVMVFPKHTELENQWASTELPVYSPPVEMPATTGQNHWHPSQVQQTQQNPSDH
ncbi:hypothetical protein C8A00DRAFT_39610 [Chaetomidium leptoderma]|uniref:Uncharacterized protein n=1 Tax=Chaetomidium leptoderma TaxID=669021 RepID=A0AAN6VUR8_9PEZI|nr:hypothetical protein C8A00DRAFT_39610 [Chaetomidium leptoderma]